MQSEACLPALQLYTIGQRRIKECRNCRKIKISMPRIKTSTQLVERRNVPQKHYYSLNVSFLELL
jgi:hypothetical protein